MEYEVSYGVIDNTSVLETFDTFEKAEEFVYKNISQYFPFSHYIRKWTDDTGITMYDFGSHSRFYFIKEVA